MRRGSVLGVVVVGAALTTGVCHARETRESDGSFFVRLSIGGGSHAGSEHAELMSKDGYKLENRTWIAADFGAVIDLPFCLGGWGAYGWSSDEAPRDAPNLKERTAMFGLQAPLAMAWENVVLVVSPRFGAAANKLELYERGDWSWGPAIGLEVGLMLVHAPLGISTGYLYAPTGEPSDLGRSYQAGGTYLLFSGIIDDF